MILLFVDSCIRLSDRAETLKAHVHECDQKHYGIEWTQSLLPAIEV